jgi:hypothetical protein
MEKNSDPGIRDKHPGSATLHRKVPQISVRPCLRLVGTVWVGLGYCIASSSRYLCDREGAEILCAGICIAFFIPPTLKIGEPNKTQIVNF